MCNISICILRSLTCANVVHGEFFGSCEERSAHCIREIPIYKLENTREFGTEAERKKDMHEL